MTGGNFFEATEVVNMGWIAASQSYGKPLYTHGFVRMEKTSNI